MAGGHWTLQDKIRPEHTFDLKTQNGGSIGLGGSGIVTMAVELGVGPQGVFTGIDR